MIQSDPSSFRACVVSVKFPTLKDESSACGTLAYSHQGIIISHGSIFTEYALRFERVASKVKGGELLTASDFNNGTFFALLDRRITESINAINYSSIESKICTEQSSLDFNRVPCEFLFAFRNNDFHTTVNQIMPDSNWHFVDSEDQESKSLEDNPSKSSQIQETERTFNGNLMSFHLSSYFCVLKIEALKFKSHAPTSHSQKLLPFPSMMFKECHIGETAELITTPFGALCPSVFFNSYSRGVICNISGKNDCWIITDARCIPGSEGGPLFVKSKSDDIRYLSGIITCSLCWKNNEWVGFSVACSLKSIHNSLLIYSDSYLKPHFHGLDFQMQQIKAIDFDRIYSPKFITTVEEMSSNTVLVQVGSTWGSGVIVDRYQGIILTCSHVVKDADVVPGSLSHQVLITPYKSSSHYPATVEYRQKPLKGPYDLAVVKCEAVQQLSSDHSLDISLPSVGQEVNVLGHAVFSTHLNLGPSLTNGVISKIITYQNKPTLIQTTCAVHPGVSGGPLLSSDGNLVGIVVCNTKDNSNNSSFPHVNMCVPMIAIWPVLECYLKTRDKDVLSALKIKNAQISQLWALGKATSENMHNMTRSKL